MKRIAQLLYLVVLINLSCSAQSTNSVHLKDVSKAEPVIVGAERIPVYVPLIKGKRVGIFANQTSMVGNRHLVDTLQKLGVDIRVIFGPEHGFRGKADAGEKMGNEVDQKTGIRIVSLYGKKSKPSKEDLKDIDVLVFDIQDVGTRFYTFISSLEEFMNVALEMGIPLMILDRPNPNGHYIDGPVLDKKYKSFVGMQSIPVVYGLTIGEYAMMLAGERWLSDGANKKYDYYRVAENSKDTAFHFIVIKCKNYDHSTLYKLPVRPSPNLPDMGSIYWYPSTCFFEGTVLSEGRGTDKPFQIIGHPALPKKLYSFTPNPTEGAKSSKLYGKKCYGWNLSGTDEQVLKSVNSRLQLDLLLKAYKLFPDKKNFFILPKGGSGEQAFFNKLAGNSQLMQQIKAGVSEEKIRQSWQADLNAYKEVRKKYLLYEDFE